MFNNGITIEYIRFVVELSGITEFLDFAKEEQYYKILNAAINFGIIDELFPKSSISYKQAINRLKKFKTYNSFVISGKIYSQYRGLCNINNLYNYIWPDEFEYIPENISKEQLIRILTNYINKLKNCALWRTFKIKYSNVYHYIFDILYPIPFDYNLKIQSMQSYVYMIENDMNEYPRSLVFKKYVTFDNRTRAFKIFSSNYEKNHTKEGIDYINEQRKKTFINKYGTYYTQTDEFKRKAEETNLRKYGYKSYSQTNEYKQKVIETNQKKYKVNYPQQSKEIRNKSKNTTKQHWGTECPLQSPEIKEKIKQTNLKKYGVENPSQAEIVKRKKENTTFKHFGVLTPFESQEIKNKIDETNFRKYKTTKPMKNSSVVQKSIETKKLNNSFNKSQPEEYINESLIKIFGKENIIRQYHSERYPFNCDFYIKSLDMFIEYQGFWTHNDHPYDSNLIEDQNILKLWKSKSEEKEHYKNAIDVWTIRDPLKRQTAKDNNLNYIELWNMNDVEAFLNYLLSL